MNAIEFPAPVAAPEKVRTKNPEIRFLSFRLQRAFLFYSRSNQACLI